MDANQRRRIPFWLQLIGFVIGFGVGWFVVFQILFLWRVIPHGGL